MFSTRLEEFASRRKSFNFDRLSLYSIGPSLIILIIHWAYVYFKIGFKNTTLVLHYNVIYGTDLVQKGHYLYLVPLTALGMLLINLSLGRYFAKKEKLAAYFLDFSNIVIQFVFISASLIILHINGQ